MMTEYFAAIDSTVTPHADNATRMASAIAGQGPTNGPRIAADVRQWIDSRSRAEAFSEEQVKFLSDAVHSKSGLSTLWALMRAQQTSGPPSAASEYSTAQHGVQQGREELWKELQKDNPDERKVQELYDQVGKGWDVTHVDTRSAAGRTKLLLDTELYPMLE